MGAIIPSAVTGGRICIRSMHNWKNVTLQIPFGIFLDFSRVILTHNSLKMFLECIFITGTLNVNNLAVSEVNYSSNIDHVTENSSNGDLQKYRRGLM